MSNALLKLYMYEITFKLYCCTVNMLRDKLKRKHNFLGGKINVIVRQN
jgi:hypothetical protein